MRQNKKFGFLWLEAEFYTNEYGVAERFLYYDRDLKRWTADPINNYDYSIPCHSLRAALRHIKRHNEIPKGWRFRLVNKYVDGDNYIITKR